jgi:hypothetical protein
MEPSGRKVQRHGNRDLTTSSTLYSSKCRKLNYIELGIELLLVHFRHLGMEPSGRRFNDMGWKLNYIL